MKKVFKFHLGWGGGTVTLPKGAQVLSAGEQDDDLVLWALVDPNAGPHDRVFIVAGTGHRIEDDEALEFIGTVRPDDMYVFHVFEDLNWR